jgi:hypothetical protein
LKTQKITKKILAIGIIVIFLSINSMASAIDSLNCLAPKRFEDDPVFFVYGTKGLNDWYISDVTVAFDYDPQRVEEIQYYLNNQWHVYTAAFVVSIDGVYYIEWFWLDDIGKTHDGFPPIQFKLDKTKPTIELKRKFGTNNKVTFTATASDSMSGLQRIEFYFDDEKVDEFFESPCSWEWVGVAQHFVYAISYDKAGLSEKSETLGTRTRTRSNINFFIFRFSLFLKLQYIIQNLIN